MDRFETWVPGNHQQSYLDQNRERNLFYTEDRRWRVQRDLVMAEKDRFGKTGIVFQRFRDQFDRWYLGYEYWFSEDFGSQRSGIKVFGVRDRTG